MDNENVILNFVIPSLDDRFMRSNSQQGHIDHKIPQVIAIVDLSLVLKVKLLQQGNDQMEK